MAYKVLLVEDDIQIREVIEDFFDEKEKDNIIIVSTPDGKIGMDMIDSNTFDLILLDIMLPGCDGFTLMRHIRRTMDVPVIFLTAKNREEDKIRGYELGCDDYVTKPFSLVELDAKVNALLRRAKGLVIREEITCGDIVLNPFSLMVKVKGNIVDLPPKEYEILFLLLENRNRVLSREVILSRVWGADYFGDARVVDTHIKKLRKALDSAGNQIKTVISKGYKMTED